MLVAYVILGGFILLSGVGIIFSAAIVVVGIVMLVIAARALRNAHKEREEKVVASKNQPPSPPGLEELNKWNVLHLAEMVRADEDGRRLVKDMADKIEKLRNGCGYSEADAEKIVRITEGDAYDKIEKIFLDLFDEQWKLEKRVVGSKEPAVAPTGTTPTSEDLKPKKRMSPWKIVILIIVIILLIQGIESLVGTLGYSCENLSLYGTKEIVLGNGVQCVSFSLDNGAVSPPIHIPSGSAYSINTPGNRYFWTYSNDGSSNFVNSDNAYLGLTGNVFEVSPVQNNTQFTVTLR